MRCDFLLCSSRFRTSRSARRFSSSSIESFGFPSRSALARARPWAAPPPPELPNILESRCELIDGEDVDEGVWLCCGGTNVVKTIRFQFRPGNERGKPFPFPPHLTRSRFLWWRDGHVWVPSTCCGACFPHQEIRFPFLHRFPNDGLTEVTVSQHTTAPKRGNKTTNFGGGVEEAIHILLFRPSRSFFFYRCETRQ